MKLTKIERLALGYLQRGELPPFVLSDALRRVCDPCNLSFVVPINAAAARDMRARGTWTCPGCGCDLVRESEAAAA